MASVNSHLHASTKKRNLEENRKGILQWIEFS